MKKLIILFLFFALIGCESKDKSVIQPDANVVFFTTKESHFIQGVFGERTIFYDHQNPNPQCTSYHDSNSKFLVTYLKGGVYNVTVTTNIGDVVFKITVHEGYCNVFDVSQAYAWQ